MHDGAEGTLFVSDGACKGAKNHGRGKPPDEEPPYVPAFKAIVLVERVDVGTLQPVASCTHRGCW